MIQYIWGDELANKNLGRIDCETNQICWVCKNAYSGCNWSAEFLPVQGWDATYVKKKGVPSFSIKGCPEFEYDGQCSRCNKCPKEQKHNPKFSNICNFFVGDGNTICRNFEKNGVSDIDEGEGHFEW